jgi:hypothetical protein
VQHLSRKELAALDAAAADGGTDGKASTVLPLLVPDLEHGGGAPNGTLHGGPTVYDNPTFKNQPTTDDDDNQTAF